MSKYRLYTGFWKYLKKINSGKGIRINRYLTLSRYSENEVFIVVLLLLIVTFKDRIIHRGEELVNECHLYTTYL